MEAFSNTQKQGLKLILDEVNFIAKTSFQHMEGINQTIAKLNARAPNALKQAKASIPQILHQLRSVTESLQIMARSTQQFENIVLVPNLARVHPQEEGEVWEMVINYKNQSVNEHESMIVEQIEEEEKEDEINYEQLNASWADKMKSINNTINKCAQYAEKNAL